MREDSLRWLAERDREAVNRQHPDTRATPLHVAASKNFIDIMRSGHLTVTVQLCFRSSCSLFSWNGPKYPGPVNAFETPTNRQKMNSKFNWDPFCSTPIETQARFQLWFNPF